MAQMRRPGRQRPGTIENEIGEEAGLLDDEASSSSARFRNGKSVIFWVLYAGFACSVIARSCLDIAAPAMIKDRSINVTESAVADMMMWGSVAAAGGKLVGGFMIDGVGGSIASYVSYSGLATASLAFAFASKVSTMTWIYMCTKAFQVTLYPAMGKVSSGWFHDDLGSVWGLLSTSCRVGSLIAIVLLSLMLTVSHWRALFLAGAAACGVAAVAGIIFLSDFAPGHAPDPEVVGGREGETGKGGIMLSTWTSYRFWLMLGATACLTPVFDFPSLLPLFLKARCPGLSPLQLTLMMVSHPLGSCLATFMAGMLYDSVESRKTLFWAMSSMLTCGTVCMVVLYQIDSAQQCTPGRANVVMLILFLIGACCSPPYYLPPTMFALDFGGHKFMATVLSLLDCAGFLCSVAFFRFVSGQGNSIDWGRVLAMMCVLLCGALFFLGRFLWIDAVEPTEDVMQPSESGVEASTGHSGGNGMGRSSPGGRSPGGGSGRGRYKSFEEGASGLDETIEGSIPQGLRGTGSWPY